VSGNFTLDLYGNIINDGTWSHYYIYLKGDTPQHISCLNDNVFELSYFANQNTSDLIIADSDLNFSGAQIDFYNDDLDLTGGHNFSLEGGRLFRCNVLSTSSSIYDFSNDAYFYNSTIDLGILDGVFRTYGTCTLGDITINGILENHAGSSVTITITGNVINNGEVRNNLISGNLILLVAGNITNNGPWTNYRTDLNGTIDQEITIPNNNDITGQVRFISDASGSPYQWYFDGSILNNADFSGETSNTLTWLVDISETYFGTFYCQTGTVPSRNITIGPGGFKLDVTAYLEGPYNGGGMNNGLLYYIPLNQPYNVYPWEYNGSEMVGGVPENAVDWILIEIRDAANVNLANSTTSLGGQAAFIMNDGSIVDLDGESFLSFDYTISQNLFIVLWHRNHLPVVSNFALTNSGGTYSYDFTTAANQAYNDNQSDLGGGKFGMIGGDANADGAINDNDGIETWIPQVGQMGYLQGDGNLDLQVNNQDKNDVWLPNYGKTEQLPPEI